MSNGSLREKIASQIVSTVVGGIVGALLVVFGILVTSGPIIVMLGGVTKATLKAENAKLNDRIDNINLTPRDLDVNYMTVAVRPG